MAMRMTDPVASGDVQPAFGSQTRWPPAPAIAAATAVLLVSAAAATVISTMFPGHQAGDGTLPGPRTAGSAVPGLIWLLAFQNSVVVLTLLASRGYGGAPRRVLSLNWPTNAIRTVVTAVASLGLFAAGYTALVLAFDRAAVLRDLAPAADLARSEYWLLALGVIGLGAPVSEELLFRGFLFPALAQSRLGSSGAAVISTAAWTSLHAGYSVYGLVEVFLVGLWFSWLMVRSRSIWVPILCHATYNTAIFLALRWLPVPL